MANHSFSIGQRVRLVNDVERYPHFIAGKGLTGTVTVVEPDLVAVKMDALLSGAEEWGNEVHWYPSCDDDAAADLSEVLECEACGRSLPVPERYRSRDGDACPYCGRQLDDDTKP